MSIQKRLRVLLAILFFVAIPAILVYSLAISNGILKVDVDKYGDYKISTTEGDSLIDRDDERPILNSKQFGSSFILVSVDGKLGKFGWSMGKNQGVTRRINGKLHTVWDYEGIRFTQIISLYKGLYAKTNNLARIVMYVENKSSRDKKVGFRVVLDPVLGYDDALGIFVPGKGYAERGLILRDDVPNYLYLNEHKLRKTVNTLIDFSGRGLVRPDEIYIGKREYIHPAKQFEIKTDEDFGDSFLRESNIALVWKPRSLGAGKKNGIAYAIGVALPSITSKSVLTTTLMAPEKTRTGSSFWVSATLNNSDKFWDVENVSVKPDFDTKKLRLLSQKRVFAVNTLEGGQRFMAYWKMKLLNGAEKADFTVRILSDYRNKDLNLNIEKTIHAIRKKK